MQVSQWHRDGSRLEGLQSSGWGCLVFLWSTGLMLRRDAESMRQQKKWKNKKSRRARGRRRPERKPGHEGQRHRDGAKPSRFPTAPKRPILGYPGFGASPRGRCRGIGAFQGEWRLSNGPRVEARFGCLRRRAATTPGEARGPCLAGRLGRRTRPARRETSLQKSCLACELTSDVRLSRYNTKTLIVPYTRTVRGMFEPSLSGKTCDSMEGGRYRGWMLRGAQ